MFNGAEKKYQFSLHVHAYQSILFFNQKYSFNFQMGMKLRVYQALSCLIIYNGLFNERGGGGGGGEREK